MSCVSSTSCKAVGNYTNGSTGDVADRVVERIVVVTNSRERARAAPTTLSKESTCTSSTACTAVGVSYDSSVAESLVETWNGTSWSTVSSPDPSGSYNYLAGVSCTELDRLHSGWCQLRRQLHAGDPGRDQLREHLVDASPQSRPERFVQPVQRQCRVRVVHRLHRRGRIHRQRKRRRDEALAASLGTERLG